MSFKSNNHLNKLFKLFFLLFTCFHCLHFTQTNDDNTQLLDKYKNRIKEMFYHAYNSYINNAYPYDELRPVTCDGFDTWGSYSLTLIDSLDMLIILGNKTEFERVCKLIEELNFDKDINVSVFETNIRVIGGLLSAHLLSYKLNYNENDVLSNTNKLDPNWPCDGFLLRLAVKVADKILPAFNTSTGMPYGTVNLLYGVPKSETQETCTAGVGTFIIEFATLSRLTGNKIYEEIALRALDALWMRKSTLNLVGNHINVETGRWTAHDATIGSGVDSYFEYLVKGGILLNNYELIKQFEVYKNSIQTYLFHDNWFLWANMNKGQKTLPLFSSLDAFYPGILSLIGDLDQAKQTLIQYHSIWRKYGSLPEFFNVNNGDVHSNRETYPLRPELIESIMYMYQATNDDLYLQMAIDCVESIEAITRLECGYATVKDVRDHRLENRMESFFLAETLKYFYLIFDKENFLNKDDAPKMIKNQKGECLVETGFYIYNTEAHPIDGSALRCCSIESSNDQNNENEHTTLKLNQILNKYLKLNSGYSFTEENLDKFKSKIEEESEFDCDKKNLNNKTMQQSDLLYNCYLNEKFQFYINSIFENKNNFYP